MPPAGARLNWRLLAALALNLMLWAVIVAVAGALLEPL